ncbi:DNA mismatch endonuclease Vsr [Novosphingobium sp. MW5]|nr:DNA mismatch endonuclease Vsr [Novosphingobium sp. MW5]
MTDIVDKVTRSRMMAGIRGRNTRPEVLLRKALHAAGFRFRLHDRHLPGRPDIVLPRYRAVILVHGCFWHRHEGCPLTTTPATRVQFWEEKFAGNVARDARDAALLAGAGWRIGVVWECGLRGRDTAPLMARLAAWLRSDEHRLELPEAGGGERSGSGESNRGFT